jgi:hypothetical protein
MAPWVWVAEVVRRLRKSPCKSLIFLCGGGSAEVRKSLPLSLFLLIVFTAAELPPNTPLRACARVRAARLRVEAFVR